MAGKNPPINRKICDDYFKFLEDLTTDSFEVLMNKIQFNEFKLFYTFAKRTTRRIYDLVRLLQMIFI